jgi:hypothetical protein
MKADLKQASRLRVTRVRRDETCSGVASPSFERSIHTIAFALHCGIRTAESRGLLG